MDSFSHTQERFATPNFSTGRTLVSVDKSVINPYRIKFKNGTLIYVVGITDTT